MALVEYDGGALRDVRAVKGEHSQVVCMSLVGSGLSSLHGVDTFSQLWTLNLAGCKLESVKLLLPLGALGELNLANNLLDAPAALHLRQMRLGQLTLRGNPLMPAGTDDAEASLLLRSALVDALPCVLALDGSFVSSA